MIRKFNLPHVALYAKNHYLRSDNIWEDLKKILTADGYCGDVMEKEDIVTIVSNHCFALDDYDFQIDTYIKSMNPIESWKFGYYHKDISHTPELTNEYNYFEGVLRYCLSGLVSILISDLPELNPDYSVLPKNIIENEPW